MSTTTYPIRDTHSLGPGCQQCSRWLLILPFGSSLSSSGPPQGVLPTLENGHHAERLCQHTHAHTMTRCTTHNWRTVHYSCLVALWQQAAAWHLCLCWHTVAHVDPLLAQLPEGNLGQIRCLSVFVRGGTRQDSRWQDTEDCQCIMISLMAQLPEADQEPVCVGGGRRQR
jgi:hypothetical protein